MENQLTRQLFANSGITIIEKNKNHTYAYKKEEKIKFKDYITLTTSGHVVSWPSLNEIETGIRYTIVGSELYCTKRVIIK